MQRSISVANIVMGIGALVTFIFSFLSFFETPRGNTYSAWDGDAGAFATTVPAILAIVMMIWIGLELAGVSLPDEVLTFNRNQLKATWGISAFGVMVSWISADFGGADKAAGFWLMFFGSLAMTVGAVMALLGKGNETVDLPGSGDAEEATAPPPAG